MQRMRRDITEIAPVPADVRVRYGDGENQFFDCWHGRRPAGLAVMVHGGFWRARYDLLHASHLCAALAAEGMAVANLEYRRVGNPGGGWPGSLHDVMAGLNAARATLGRDLPTVLLGHSAGGHLALCAGSEFARLAGIVALAPVADLALAHRLNLSNGAAREFMGAAPEEAPEAWRAADPAQRTCAARAIVVHGTADDVVPVSLSRSYAGAHALAATPPQLVEVAGADHFDVIDPESFAWPTVRDSALRLLG